MKVEGRTDADEDRHAKPIDMVSHPALLLRRAESDPQNVRGRLPDLFHDKLVLPSIQLTKWRCVGARNDEARESM
jgi:hypothetical protein